MPVPSVAQECMIKIASKYQFKKSIIIIITYHRPRLNLQSFPWHRQSRLVLLHQSEESLVLSSLSMPVIAPPRCCSPCNQQKQCSLACPNTALARSRRSLEYRSLLGTFSLAKFLVSST